MASLEADTICVARARWMPIREMMGWRRRRHLHGGRRAALRAEACACHDYRRAAAVDVVAVGGTAIA